MNIGHGPGCGHRGVEVRDGNLEENPDPNLHLTLASNRTVALTLKSTLTHIIFTCFLIPHTFTPKGVKIIKKRVNKKK